MKLYLMIVNKEEDSVFLIDNDLPVLKCDTIMHTEEYNIEVDDYVSDSNVDIVFYASYFAHRDGKTHVGSYAILKQVADEKSVKVSGNFVHMNELPESVVRTLYTIL